MAPVSRSTSTPNSCPPEAANATPDNHPSAASRLFNINMSGSASSNPTKSSRWFNTNILGKAVDAINENEFQPLRGNDDGAEAEMAVEVNEDITLDDRHLPLAFRSVRHLEDIKGLTIDESAQTWRMRERMKTVSVALVVCLNIGVDPPDVKKTEPCARMECWINPLTLNSQRALETIGNNLQKQYERWQPRARYRQSLDPTVEEVRRLATGLRRNARDERVLFHYTGHGVPKPTTNGEIWVFNRSYTQYIPLSLYDLQSWMGSPSIFVYDCSNAGIIVSSFVQFAEQHEREYHEQVAAHGSSADLSPPISNRNCIQLAACSATQLLPMNPELPADLFTSCLTTPIKMALRWFVMQNQGKLAPRITMDMLDKIPGQFGDRRTMLGELNWIFTAITDTIAWNTLPRSLFQKLFRQDLLVASLFRNFLLAERVMRSYDCTPVSFPQLPGTHQHPMWKAWDLAVDVSLAQLPGILEKGTAYKASTFFEEQLTAFEVWLRFGDQYRPPPEQLPIVLQVLLSQAHRLRALDLLGRFLDLGPWAVNLALSVGIFPYVLKLLQASGRELRPLLVSIWAKILSVDTSCQTDLIRDASHRYFLSVLQDDVMMPNHRTWAAFILASIVHNFRQGQQEAEQANMIAICLEHLNDQEPVLRQWTTIALGRVWDNYEPGRWRGARDNAPEKLFELLKDDVPEVRAAAVFALGTFVNSCEVRTEHANSLDHTIALHLMKTAVEDGSSLVRTELVVALQHIVLAFEPNFINACRSFMEAEDILNKSTASDSTYAFTLSPSTSSSTSGGPSLLKSPSPSLRRTPSSIQSSSSSPALDRVGLSATRSSGSLSSMGKLSSALPNVGSVYDKVYRSLEFLSVDPHHVVSSMAQVLVMYLRQRVKSKNEMSRPSLNIPAPLFTEAFSASSVPNSPAKSAGGEADRVVGPSRSTPPPAGSDGLGILSKPLAGGVTTIKEENDSSEASSQQQQQMSKPHRKGGQQGQQPNSQTHPRLARGGSVGRHPSGQHNSNNSSTSLQTPTLAPARQSQSANVSLLANSPLPRPELSTEFIPWSAKYFTKQLMRHECVECDCDHESRRHWSREWMFNRNARIRSQAEHEYNLVRNRMAKVDSSLHPNLPHTTSVMRCQPHTTSVVVFHPYDSMMVAAGKNIITVWNPAQGSIGRMNMIDLTAKNRINISSLEIVNAHDDPVLLVGYDDGGLIVLRDFHDQSSMQMIAAWNGLRELESQRRLQQLAPAASIIASTASAKTSWCQGQSTLAQASDCRFIRLWDARREMRKHDLLTEDASGAVTSLHYAPTATSGYFGNLLVAGFTSGTIRLFDERDWNIRGPTLKLEDLQGCPILDAKFIDSAGQSQLFAGNVKGKTRLFDLRMPYQAINIGSEMSLDNSISKMAIHPRCPIFATWAQHHQVVSIHAIDQHSGSSHLVNYVKHHEEGMLTGLRLGPDSGYLRFHPHLVQLAVASREGAITVKSIRKTI